MQLYFGFMLKAIKDQNRQFFSTHFSRLNKLVVALCAAVRLNQEDYIDTKYENTTRRKLKRVCLICPNLHKRYFTSKCVALLS